MNPYYTHESDVGPVYDVANYSRVKPIATAFAALAFAFFTGLGAVYFWNPDWIDPEPSEIWVNAHQETKEMMKEHPIGMKIGVGLTALFSAFCLVAAISCICNSISGNYYIRVGEGGISLRVPDGLAGVLEQDFPWSEISHLRVVQEKRAGGPLATLGMSAASYSFKLTTELHTSSGSITSSRIHGSFINGLKRRRICCQQGLAKMTQTVGPSTTTRNSLCRAYANAGMRLHNSVYRPREINRPRSNHFMFVRKLLSWPFRSMLRLLLVLTGYRLGKRYGNLQIIDLAGEGGVADFCDQVNRALCYIREQDPRRSAWIESRLNFIVSSSLISSGGMYFRASRSCFIRYAGFYEHAVGWDVLTDDAQQVLTMTLASTIVHEATHAHIDDAGIRYDKQRRDRIERICRRQELHFMRRAAADFRDVFGRPVDWSQVYEFDHVEDWYADFWGKSRWQHLCDFVRSARQKLTGHAEPPATTCWQEQHRLYWDFTDEYQPWSIPMLYTRACHQAVANNHALAIADFRQVVHRDPDHTEALTGLGFQLYFTDQYEQAFEALVEADKRGQPDLAEWISSVLWKMNRVEEALEWLGRVTADPRDPDLLGTRAMLLLDQQRYDQALRNFRLALHDQTIDFRSNLFSYLAMRAKLLQELNHTQEYLDARNQLETIQDDWHRNCQSQPVEVAAYVIDTSPEMFRPGILTYGACLLICPAEPDLSAHARILEEVALKLLRRSESESNDYEDVYLRGLLSHHDSFPWREVPTNLTDGREVWAVDVNLDRIFLPGGRLDGKQVRCWTAQTKDGYSAWLCDDALDVNSFDESQYSALC